MKNVNKNDMKYIYKKRARFYNITANLFYVIGFREWAYRKKAVTALGLKPGDSIVEIGSGTGLNFSLLQDVIGPKGRIIGVDQSDAMLEEARKKCQRVGWHNVDLIKCDASHYKFPDNIAGVLATFSIKAMPSYDQIIANIAHSLPPERRFVILDLKRPSWASDWLRSFIIKMLSPFGANHENANYQPWISVQNYFEKTDLEEIYFGVGFIGIGEK